MKMVLQIVNDAELSVENKVVSTIGKGLVVYFCVEKGDTEDKMLYFAKKIATLRIFEDENGKTNLSINDVKGEILLVSQFTLAGDFHGQNRPSFVNAESFGKAKEMYEKMYDVLTKEYNLPVKTGVFGADMIIKQTCAGPFTAFLEK